MPREGFPRELLQAAQSERLGYFRAYTIAHPRLKAVSDALWRAIQEPAGRALILVIGPTGVGKTTLRLRMEQELQQRFLAAGASEPGRIPVVGLEAVAPDSGNFSWKEYYRRALRALEEPLIDDKIDYATHHPLRNHAGEVTVPPRVGNPELRQAMEQALRHRRPAAVLIDEAVAYLGLADNSRGPLLSCLRGLSPPVVRSQNRLSAPYATLLSCLSTHRSRAVGRSCSWCMRYRTWGCGQGGTR